MDKFLIRLYGRVQGIGYRWFIVEVAKKYNLYGWVKNREDGCVECVVEGIEENIEKFLDNIKSYPLAVIERIEKEEYRENIDCDEFIIKR